jgi:hypothetical protein
MMKQPGVLQPVNNSYVLPSQQQLNKSNLNGAQHKNSEEHKNIFSN